MLVEIKCSVCGKLNFDSDTGFYKERHHRGRIIEPCDITGPIYLDGERLYVEVISVVTDPNSPYLYQGGLVKDIDRANLTAKLQFPNERELVEVPFRFLKPGLP